MSIPNLTIYKGTGLNAVWNNAANWSGGVVPGSANTALFTQSAILTGPIEVGTLMLIGSETMTINGAIKTDSTNTCESFMVCQQSNVTFNAGSSLSDAGGFEVGVHGVGTVTVAAASGTAAAASLHMVDMKVGQFAGGVGTLNLLGGTVSVTGPALIGLVGQGTLNMSGTATETALGFGVGINAGAVGQVNMTDNANLTASAWLHIGTKVVGGVGGTATVNLSGHSSLVSRAAISVGAGSQVNLAGGALVSGAGGNGLTIQQGGVVTGNGTLGSAVHGIVDNGTLTSSGGTLVVTGNLSGMGAVQVGTGSTLDLVAGRIAVPTIAFLGSSGTLELPPEVGGHLNISGFQAGDQLLMAGIDHATWNGSTDVLTLSQHGQVMDMLTMTGVAAGSTFSVTPGIGGSVIAIVPTHH